MVSEPFVMGRIRKPGNVDLTHTHSYTSKITKAATCTARGYTAGKYCPDCKTWISGHQEVAATGKHTYKTTTTTKAITEKDGKIVTACTVCGKVSKTTPIYKASSIKATWKAVTGASGYKVTLYSAKNKAIKTIYTTKTTASFSKLSKGTTYKVRVTAYKTVGKDKLYASTYTQLTTATKPGTPTLSATAGTKKATLKWNKQTGATGYVVYMATSKNGKYTKIATLKGNTKVSYTKTGLTKGKTYYFKVAAYETVGGKNIYGSFSSVKYAKIK